jgi:hypothetical protein
MTYTNIFRICSCIIHLNKRAGVDLFLYYTFEQTCGCAYQAPWPPSNVDLTVFNLLYISQQKQIPATVDAKFKFRTVLDRLCTETSRSNPARGMDVAYVRGFGTFATKSCKTVSVSFAIGYMSVHPSARMR